uniref:Protein TIC 214 n=1 Tax=Ophioglossum hongii TaxID=3238578 RepID=A0AB39U2U5_9MONI
MIILDSFGLLCSQLQVPVLAWANAMGPFLIFGLYYGFLTTLPIGISQILSIRSFLLEGNLGGTVSITGSIIGQTIILLSMYCSPLYTTVMKPHAITLTVLPFMLFHWYKTKDLYKFKTLNIVDSITNKKILNIFLTSFVFQLLNSSLLPSPVLARMVNLFHFRHSSNRFFLISSLLGWAGGNILFINLTKILLVRIECDSPILYALIKRILHRTFSIIISIILLMYLGRFPIPLATKKFTDGIILHNKSLKNKLLQDEFLWLNKPWPTSFFDQYRWNRPLRYIENSRFSRNGFVKERVSEYFFNKCLTNGEWRISFTALPSSFIFDKQLYDSIDASDASALASDCSKEWISTRGKKRKALINEFKDRIVSVGTGSTVQTSMDKIIGLSHDNNKILVKIYDPFINGSSRVEVPISKSPWLLADLINSVKESKHNYAQKVSKRNQNRIRDWMSARYKGSRRNEFPLPWDPMPTSAKKKFLSIIRGSEDSRVKKISNDFDSTGVGTQESLITWEHVFKLPILEQTIFFSQLERGTVDSIIPNSHNPPVNDLDESSVFTRSRDAYFHTGESVFSIPHIGEMQKILPRYNSVLRFNKIDAVNTNTDIRQRKMKNLGFSPAKTRLKTRKIVKRFSKQSDFRRRLVKGSMRARRRKTVVWRMLQSGTHSPFFLRMMEVPFSVSPGRSGAKESAKDAVDIKKKLISISSGKERTKADRSSIAARLDSSFIQSGRSILLILQSNLRKYVRLPILILGKNIGRLLLLKSTEWNEDWSDWNRETHVKCTYDGIEFSETHLPGRWFREGLQIKILYPFHLKPWHTRREEYSNDLFKNGEEMHKDFSTLAKREKVDFSYLTIWGYQTDLPFGSAKKQPSFWEPIGRELRTLINKNLLSRITRIYDVSPETISARKYFIITNKLNSVSVTDTQYTESTIDFFDMNQYTDQYSKSDEVYGSATVSLPGEVGRNKIDINQDSGYNIANSIIGKTKRTVEQSYLGKMEKHLRLSKKNRKYPIDAHLVWKKRFINIQQKLLENHRVIVESIQEWYKSVGISWNRIYRAIIRCFITAVWSDVQIVLKSIKDSHRVFSEKYKSKIIVTGNVQHLRAEHNRNVPLISQAYVLHRLWCTKRRIGLDLLTSTRYSQESNFKIFENDEFRIQQSMSREVGKYNFFNSHIDHFPEAQGLIEILSGKNWNKWLNPFERYNPPSKIWSGIAPKRWRIGFNKHSNLEKNQPNKQKDYNFVGGVEYSTYPENPSLERRVKNANKRYELNDLAYNYIDYPGYLDTEKSSVRRFGIEGGVTSSNCIRKIRECSTHSDRNIKLLWSRSNENKDLDLMLWLVPDLTRTKDMEIAKLTLIPKTSVLQERSRPSMKGSLGINNQYETKEIESEDSLLRERESHYYIFQWVWKSKELEKRMQQIKDLASVSSTTENEEDITSFCAEIGIDANLLNRFFTKSKHEFLDQLLTVSAHRLPRFLDDQILMHRMVSILLKLKVRFAGRIDADVFNKCISLMAIDKKMDSFDSYNLEDIMLPRRRRELRILGSLVPEEQYANTDEWNEETGEYQEFKPLDQTHILKRFLWPIHRLEDLAYMNRAWFGASNGSRSSLLRIRMYPLDQIG